MDDFHYGIRGDIEEFSQANKTTAASFVNSENLADRLLVQFGALIPFAPLVIQSQLGGVLDVVLVGAGFEVIVPTVPFVAVLVVDFQAARYWTVEGLINHSVKPF